VLDPFLARIQAAKLDVGSVEPTSLDSAEQVVPQRL
jgi:hypothetical protein